MSIPRIAITIGEPAGIGPDVTLQAAMHTWDWQIIAIGDEYVLAERAKSLGLAIELFAFRADDPPQAHRPGTLPVVNIPLANPVTAGKLEAGNAQGVLNSLNEAISGCMQSRYQAMVTAPVQKSIVNEAGIAFSGHTEFLAEATNTNQVVMMLTTKDLRVAVATTHLPLSEVPAAINGELLVQTLTIMHNDLRDKFGIAHPTLAVLGLNPHAGENGHLGREEIDTIIPALDVLRQQGLDIIGPLPADTAFNPELLARADAYLAMYHDQGLPVLKFAGFGNAINITLGLPIIRTSVDHGTALDLAGTGKAKPDSMLQAILMAGSMAELK